MIRGAIGPALVAAALVAGTAAAAPRPKLHAVVVGVERSPDGAAYKGAAASARAVAAALRAHVDYEVADDSITLLTDDKADPVTTTAILNSLHAHAADARTTDLLLFYFAGPTGVGAVSRRPALAASTTAHLHGDEIELGLVQKIMVTLARAKLRLVVIDSGRRLDQKAPAPWDPAAPTGVDLFSQAVCHEGDGAWSASDVGFVLSSSQGQPSWIEPGGIGVLSRCVGETLQAASARPVGKLTSLNDFLRDLRGCVPRKSRELRKGPASLQSVFTSGLEKQNQLVIARGSPAKTATPVRTALAIEVTPKDAEVILDGARIGSGSLTYATLSGAHDIEVQARCHLRERRSVTLAEGETQPVKIDLRPLEKATVPVYFSNAPRGLILQLDGQRIPLQKGVAVLPACKEITLQLIFPDKSQATKGPIVFDEGTEPSIDVAP
jgi:hypothetical protein